jgi:membrane protein DedA with SNARE-associated domain
MMQTMPLLDHLVQYMTSYGPLVLGLAMLPTAVGLPVPVGVLLIAAGAFVRQGIMDGPSTLLLAWLGATAGDASSYVIGRWVRQWSQGRLQERYAAVWRRAEDLFRERAGWAVFCASWLIRGLSVPTNLIAGGSGYPFRRFVALVAPGKVLWVLLHAGLGYFFASQWQLIGLAVTRYGTWLGLCAAVGAGIYLVVRRLRAHLPRIAAGDGLVTSSERNRAIPSEAHRSPALHS